MPFLRAWFKQNNDEYFGSFFWAVPIDVYVLAGEKLGDDVVNLPNLKLATMCRHFGIEVEDDRLHDAEYDIYLTKALHQKLK
jgi:DNA polymerase-3 subunit epsilon